MRNSRCTRYIGRDYLVGCQRPSVELVGCKLLPRRNSIIRRRLLATTAGKPWFAARSPLPLRPRQTFWVSTLVASRLPPDSVSLDAEAKLDARDSQRDSQRAFYLPCTILFFFPFDLRGWLILAKDSVRRKAGSRVAGRTWATIRETPGMPRFCMASQDSGTSADRTDEELRNIGPSSSYGQFSSMSQTAQAACISVHWICAAVGDGSSIWGLCERSAQKPMFGNWAFPPPASHLFRFKLLQCTDH